VAAVTAAPAGAFAALSRASWRAYLLAVVCSAALLLHRRHPWAAQAGVSAGMVAAPLVGVEVEVVVGAFAVLVLLVVAGPARLPAVPVAVAGTAAFVAASLMAAAVAGGALPIDDLVFGGFFMGFTVALATSLRRHRQDAVELATRNAELERLRDAEAQRAVAEERTRIAREMHDIVAHHVSAVVVRAQAALHVHDRRPDEAVEALRYTAAVGGETLGALRGVLGLLRAEGETTELGPQPGLAGLPALVSAAREAGQEVSCEMGDGVSTLPAATQAVAYRVVQEALTNARRHAPGAPVAVQVTRSAGELTVVVRNPLTRSAVAAADSGVVAANGAGHGVAGMRERAAAVGGRVSADGRDGLWQVRLAVPLPAPGSRR
jgi:signal transduction histidine kinase